MLTVDLRQLDRLRARLERSPLIDASLGEALGEQSLDQARERFRTSTGPDGSRWPRRKDPGPTHPLLVKSGALLSSLRVRDDGAAGIAVGTAGIPYAAVHQWGYPPFNIPPRPFLGWGDDDMRALELTADQWLQAHVGAALA